MLEMPDQVSKRAWVIAFAMPELCFFIYYRDFLKIAGAHLNFAIQYVTLMS